MGQKFTSNDLFRIATDNLSDVEFAKFRFACETSLFRQGVAGQFTDLDFIPNVTADEQNLLQKLFQGLKVSRGRGAR